MTRDRVELEATWRGRRFSLVDTAGYLHEASGIEVLARGQADRAIDEADLIMLVVDAQASITEEDGALARRLRRAEVPVLVVANKVDTDREESDAAVFHSLGLGDPFRSRACTGAPPGIYSTASSQLLPDAPRDDEGSDAGEPQVCSGRQAERRASPACSTASWGRSARSCSRRPARPATLSTRSCSGRTARLDSSTPRACAATPRSRGRVLQRRAQRRRPSSERDVAMLVIDAERGLHRRGQEDRERRDRGGPGAARRREQVGSR